MSIKKVLWLSFLVSSTYAGLVQQRVRRLRASSPSARVTPLTSELFSDTVESNTSHVSYSSNWAGAVLTAPPTGSTFTSVSAQFTVPTPKGDGAASAWVGIDGDTYAAAILQTGIDFTMKNGALSYNAWYEWYPDFAYEFSTIKISPGDVMSMSVASTSPSSGIATIENISTGQKVSSNLNAPSVNTQLAGQNAEWIVEDFQQNGALVPLTNFGTIAFTNSQASTSAHQSVDTTGAQLLDIKQSNNVVTTSTASGSSITVVHK